MSDFSSQKYQTLYLIFALSILIAVFGTPMMQSVGILALIVTTGLCYYERHQSETDAPHATRLIRTFWIGGLIIFPAATLAHFIAIITLTDFGHLLMSAYQGDYGLNLRILETDYQTFQANNAVIMVTLKWLCYMPAVFWWLHRCYQGYSNLK